VQSLRDLAEELKITPHVQFIVNASYPEMLGWLAVASIGLSTMVDEHFGINVVEFMVQIPCFILFCSVQLTSDETRLQV
jgi:alpha-1,2-mannosyltransferase